MGGASQVGDLTLYTPYSARMSPEDTHKLMGLYMEVLILGVILQYMVSSCYFKLFPIGCIGLIICSIW